jgi:hypothetical protein
VRPVTRDEARRIAVNAEWHVWGTRQSRRFSDMADGFAVCAVFGLGPMILGLHFLNPKYGLQGSPVVSAMATTTGTAYIPPSGSTSVSSSQSTIPLVIDWHTHPRVPAAGKVMVIEDATPTSLVYRIE